MENSHNSGSQNGKFTFVLFVSGMSVKSGHAIENLRKICDLYLKDNFELQIIDITKDREQAVKHQIIAIPTLIKTGPSQPRTILGDLSDTEKVLRILDIKM